ncbi:hypothetical protein GKE82_02790 [Conexibacter sp. W3-3-2]|uniref:Uncharacterized protein n=1 Tax=Paraconexibacter algicola TaxID=2133960 RepID=A0A2T4UCQ9_9ACTN|nr:MULTISPECIES: hypothetical protein [Solirubrobacterales]MTD43260.1 hypothetical protein [Conexibacter sp. W3-3-2]PTL55003.1 hypothetical protein C7Y72_20750 [Paraconexibacter algicola]
MIASLAARTPDDLEDELQDARSSLRYWERRLRATGRGPRHRRRRREAQQHVVRWTARVHELERRRFGTGARGALVQLVEEQRLPAVVRHRGRTVARRTRTVLVVGSVAVGVTLLAVLAAVLVTALRVVGVL